MTDDEAVLTAKAQLMERYGLSDIAARLMLARRADARGRTLVEQARAALSQNSP